MRLVDLVSGDHSDTLDVVIRCLEANIGVSEVKWSQNMGALEAKSQKIEIFGEFSDFTLYSLISKYMCPTVLIWSALGFAGSQGPFESFKVTIQMLLDDSQESQSRRAK